ncbi:MAG TPA: MerR family transcriptional regulator [Anaeromyxobacteraceae bacterium]|nr:MerR family transcriptional regulator [Anaeromyxobacteraceae bacterium]
MGADYTSGDLARATGNTVRTIRFYEEEGILEPAEVSDGGHRRYTDDDLERLKLIGDLRELGLSLCEIKDILTLRKGCSCVAEFAERLEASLAGHVAEAQRRMERLERVRHEIQRTIDLIHHHLVAGDGKDVRPCDLSCSPDAPKMLRVLAPRDTLCVLHESEEDRQRVAEQRKAATPRPAQVVEAEPSGWVLGAEAKDHRS